MFQVQFQYIPFNDSIWVARLNPDDPLYDYNNEAKAQAKADELQSGDPTGRAYRVSQITIV